MSAKTRVCFSQRLLLLAAPFLIAIPLLLAACSGQSTPKAIAVYPQKTPVVPPAPYPVPPVIVYHGFLDLEVRSADRAVDQASDLAAKYGGYLAGLQSWQVGGQTVISIDLVVPTPGFEPLRLGLRQLGTVLNESVTGEPLHPQPGRSQIYPPSYSTITVQLRAGGVAWPTASQTGWNPGRTVQRAFAVFMTIFGFLADTLIWIVVVLGPFIAIGLLAYLLVRRTRKV